MAARGFQRPSNEDALNAVGLKESKASALPSSSNKKKYLLRFKELYSSKERPCPPLLANYLEPFTGHFSPIPLPGPSDWLAGHTEAGQTFEDFIKRSGVEFPGPKGEGKGTTIVIQPFGDIDVEFLQPLQEYASLFFCMPVKILPAVPLSKEDYTNRWHDGHLQYKTKDIMRTLSAHRSPNTYCILGILMDDIYPDEEWNFVFGIADVLNRRGLYSLARYKESFYEYADEGSGAKKLASGDDGSMTPEQRLAFYRRCFKVMTHEIGHMFGLRHCIFFNCLMNGSNHLEENDRKPLHECPVCLRKLQYSIKFDITERYRALRQYHLDKSIGQKEEAEWIEKRLESVFGEGSERAGAAAAAP